jgi:hypothetical protein
MQVDNSGTTVVLDAKTTQAIEEGKNRITLLQVEELRLKNLKKGLEAEIIKLEADIDYKEDKVVELGGIIEDTEKELELLKEQVALLASEQADLLAEVNKREEAVQAKETALHEKELALNAQQARLNDLTERTEKDWAIAEKDKDIAQERIRKINEFLKSL